MVPISYQFDSHEPELLMRREPMAPSKKGKGKRAADRMRKLRAQRKEKREEAQRLETKRQAAILLKTLSRREIV